MRILAVGGGSGGHVTPVVAVLRELKKRDEAVEIRFWCDRKFYPQARGIIHHFDDTVIVERIVSGKFRRFHRIPWWRQLTRPSLVLPNIRDSFLIVIGFLQSIVKLILWRPDVVFTKGGFVCLPVGLAARILGIPLVIHDSDAHPGLTNRLLAPHATFIATGAPLEHYKYPKGKSRYVGIPVAEESRQYTDQERRRLKAEFGLDADRPLLLVTGGGLGATRINNAVVATLDDLLQHVSVVLVSGTGQYDELAALVPHDRPRYFQLHAFVSPLIPMIAAADIVVSRAGATTLLELAAMAKPTVLIPSAYLTGGHQLKNAEVYAKKDAVVVVDERDLEAEPRVLRDALKFLLEDTDRLEALGRKIHAFATPHAARDVADMILEAQRRR